MLINHTMDNLHNLHRCPCKGNCYYVPVNLIRMTKNRPVVHRAGYSMPSLRAVEKLTIFNLWFQLDTSNKREAVRSQQNGGETDRVTNPTVTLIRRNRSENTFPVLCVYRCV